MSEVINIAKEVLSDTNSTSGTDYLVRLEQLRVPLLTERVEAYQKLVTERERLRMPNYPPDSKDKSMPRYTDFDRRTMLEAAVADFQAKYELVKGLEELVAQRVEVVKLLMGAK